MGATTKRSANVRNYDAFCARQRARIRKTLTTFGGCRAVDGPRAVILSDVDDWEGSTYAQAATKRERHAS